MPYRILIIHVGVSGTTVQQTQMTYLLFPQGVIFSLDNMFCFFFSEMPEYRMIAQEIYHRVVTGGRYRASRNDTDLPERLSVRIH